MILGASIALWLLYALIACLTKHEIGLIVASIWGITAGICAGVARGDYTTLIGSLIGIIVVLFVIPIQVKSKYKAEWKENREKAKLERQREQENKEQEFDDKITYSTENKEVEINDIEVIELDKNDGLCPYCRSKIKKGAKFCNKCGSDISDIKEIKIKIFKANLREFKTKVIKFEKYLLISFILFCTCLLILPTTTVIVHNEKIGVKHYETTLLNALDEYDKTYMQEVKRNDTTQYIVYQKTNGVLKCYAFTKSLNAATNGYASKGDIINYFNNLTTTKPPASFVCPILFSITLILVVGSFILSITMLVLLKYNEKKIIVKLTTESDIKFKEKLMFIANNKKYENGLISNKEYKLMRKNILQRVIGNKYKFIL